jgi:hypothetical protein
LANKENDMKKLLTLIPAFLMAGFLLAWQGAAQAQTAFSIPYDAARRFTSNIRPAPTYVNARVLAAGVSETALMPAGTRFVVFSSECNFYAKPGAAAAVPGADITDGTASELNPSAWYFPNPITATQQITVVTTAAACIVTLSGYTGPLQ